MSDDPKQILALRLAKGEIGKEEYLELSQLLDSTSAPQPLESTVASEPEQKSAVENTKSTAKRTKAAAPKKKPATKKQSKAQSATKSSVTKKTARSTSDGKAGTSNKATPKATTKKKDMRKTAVKTESSAKKPAVPSGKNKDSQKGSAPSSTKQGVSAPRTQSVPAPKKEAAFVERQILRAPNAKGEMYAAKGGSNVMYCVPGGKNSKTVMLGQQTGPKCSYISDAVFSGDGISCVYTIAEKGLFGEKYAVFKEIEKLYSTKNIHMIASGNIGFLEGTREAIYIKPDDDRPTLMESKKKTKPTWMRGAKAPQGVSNVVQYWDNRGFTLPKLMQWCNGEHKAIGQLGEGWPGSLVGEVSFSRNGQHYGYWCEIDGHRKLVLDGKVVELSPKPLGFLPNYLHISDDGQWWAGLNHDSVFVAAQSGASKDAAVYRGDFSIHSFSLGLRQGQVTYLRVDSDENGRRAQWIGINGQELPVRHTGKQWLFGMYQLADGVLLEVEESEKQTSLRFLGFAEAEKCKEIVLDALEVRLQGRFTYSPEVAVSLDRKHWCANAYQDGMYLFWKDGEKIPLEYENMALLHSRGESAWFGFVGESGFEIVGYRDGAFHHLNVP